MKTLPFPPVARIFASAAGLLLVQLVATAPALRAVTITASIAMPNSALDPLVDPFDDTTWPTTESSPTIGTFNFSSNFGTLPALNGLSIQLKFFNLDTNTIGFDFNNITLALGTPGSMYNTGVKVNGFGNSTVTGVVFGSANLAGNAAAIYTALQASGGFLTVGLLDATGAPTNPFLFKGGTATLSIADRVIPFTPTQSLGFGVLAVILAFWRFPQLKRLVLARA
jgi:hypothetical protein